MEAQPQLENTTEKRAIMNGKPVYQVPAKSVINWESGFRHKLLCDGPTFSTGSACAYSCSFCYVPDIMAKSPHMKGVNEKFEDIVIRRQGSLEALKQQLASKKGRALAEQKLVIYASPLVDVAANMDLVRETIEICKEILASTAWDIRLLSKSNLLPKIAQGLSAADSGCYTSDWTCKGDKARVIYGVSTGTLDDQLAKAFEEGTPLVSKRIQSLHWLQDNGYRTFGMVCPSLPQKDYNIFSQSMMAAIRADRCEHIWAEVINLRGESFTRTIKALVLAGYEWEADQLRLVSTHKNLWEQYARQTFFNHELAIKDSSTKLRFLQYVTKETRPYWERLSNCGAVLL